MLPERGFGIFGGKSVIFPANFERPAQNNVRKRKGLACLFHRAAKINGCGADSQTKCSLSSVYAHSKSLSDEDILSLFHAFLSRTCELVLIEHFQKSIQIFKSYICATRKPIVVKKSLLVYWKLKNCSTKCWEKRQQLINL